MAEMTHARGITRTRRHLLAGMSISRPIHLRDRLRRYPGQLGPNPDQLVAGLLGVILVVSLTLAMLSAVGYS
jgi:hypothetical protein